MTLTWWDRLVATTLRGWPVYVVLAALVLPTWLGPMWAALAVGIVVGVWLDLAWFTLLGLVEWVGAWVAGVRRPPVRPGAYVPSPREPEDARVSA